METTPGFEKAAKPHVGVHEENFKHFMEGVQARFPKFKHEQQLTVVNVNEVVDERLSMGDKIADTVAATMGSWRFIITQSTLLALWIILNTVALIAHWDSYPFILLNLALSFQAAYAAPFIMMSQNRQATKDRLTAENDYKTDVKGEQEICHVIDHLDHQDALILQVVERLVVQGQRIDQQEQLILKLVEKIDVQQRFMKQQHEDMLKALGQRPAGENQ